MAIVWDTMGVEVLQHEALIRQDGSGPCRNTILDGEETRPCGMMRIRCANCDSFTFCRLCDHCVCDSPRAHTPEEILALRGGQPPPKKGKRNGNK